jgi:2'-5' RNA ligase
VHTKTPSSGNVFCREFEKELEQLIKAQAELERGCQELELELAGAGEQQQQEDASRLIIGRLEQRLHELSNQTTEMKRKKEMERKEVTA